MAEMNASVNTGRKKKSGGQRSKKLSTRVDLTPMVDLGFLLITFFIFTTTMSLPKAVRLILPEDSTDSTFQKASGALTIFPSGNDRLFYYEGIDPSKIQSSTIGSLRTIIREKQMRTDISDFMVIIKPTAICSYKNTIAVLDEMAISQVKKYAFIDMSRNEVRWIGEKEK